MSSDTSIELSKCRPLLEITVENTWLNGPHPNPPLWGNFTHSQFLSGYHYYYYYTFFFFSRPRIFFRLKCKVFFLDSLIHLLLSECTYFTLFTTESEVFILQVSDLLSNNCMGLKCTACVCFVEVKRGMSGKPGHIWNLLRLRRDKGVVRAGHILTLTVYPPCNQTRMQLYILTARKR